MSKGRSVTLKWDTDADVWYVATSGILPGLNVEAATLPELLTKLGEALADLDYPHGSNAP